MSVLVAFSVTPLGVGEDVGDLVAEAVRVVRSSGLSHQTNAMFTLVEGETWNEVMAVVTAAVEAVTTRTSRVVATIHADCRPTASHAMVAKVDRIESLLAQD